MMPRKFMHDLAELAKPVRWQLLTALLLQIALGLSLGVMGDAFIKDHNQPFWIGLLAFAALLTLRTSASLLSDHLALHIYARARKDISERIMRHMPHYKQKLSPGAILDRFYGDLYAVFDAFSFSTLQVASQIFMLLAATATLTLTSSYQGLIAILIGLALYTLMSLSFKPRVEKHSESSRNIEAQLYTKEKNLVEGYDHLKTSNTISTYLETHHVLIKNWLKYENSKYLLQNMADTMSWAVRLIFMILVLTPLSQKLGLTSQALFWVFIAIGATSQIYWAIHNLFKTLPQMKRSEIFFESVPSRTHLNLQHADTLSLSIQNLIVPLDPRQKSERSIGPFDFKWMQGERIWVRGPSGSGKTTLLRALLGLTPVASGRIDFTLRDFQPLNAQSIAYVEQDPFFFDNENLATNLGIAHTDQLNWEWIAHLDLTSFFQSLPQGLQTRIGREGIQPSRGQKIRLAILRALSQKPQILFVDEPSAGLEDALAEKTLLFIAREMGQGILILSEHRTALAQLIRPSQIVDIQHRYEFGSREREYQI